MSRTTKAALAALAVALTGPIGLLAIAVYYLRKQSERQAFTPQKPRLKHPSTFIR